MIKITKNSSDYELSKVISLVFFIQCFNLEIKHILQVSNVTVRHFISWVGVFIVGVCLLRALHNLKKNVIAYGIVAYAVIISLYLISFLRAPNDTTMYVLTQAAYTLFMVLPMVIFGASLDQWDDLWIMMEKQGVFLIALGFVSYLSMEKSLFEYDMAMCMILLPYVMLRLRCVFRHVSFSSVVIAVLGVTEICLFGTRGALVCLLFYFSTLVILSSYIRTQWKVVLITISILAIVIMLSGSFVAVLNDWLTEMGINNRTLYLILNGQFFDSSGRNNISEIVLQQINLHPIFGNGIATEYQYIKTYPHNFILEVLYDFGIVLGVLLLIVFSSLVAKVMFFMGKRKRNDMLFFVSMGLVPLMVSGTYLTSIPFGVLFGYILSASRTGKKEA